MIGLAINSVMNGCRHQSSSYYYSKVLKRFNHFETLGVTRSSSTKDIKIAFRKKAMEFHPDKLHNATKREIDMAHEKFVKLRQAYDILVDPDKRSLYIAEIDLASSSASTYRANVSYTSTGATDYSQFRYGYYNQQRYDGYDYDDRVLEDRESFIRSRKSFKETWDAAIHTAMHGSIDSETLHSLSSFPEQIETEELKSLRDMKADGVISHIVYGRTVLGTIVYSSGALPNGEQSSLLEIPKDPNNQQYNMDCLHLFFRDKLWASCLRSQRPTSDPNGHPGELDTVFEFETKFDFHGNIFDSLKPFGRAVLFPESFFQKTQEGFLFDENNEMIYRLKTFRQVGVDNFHIFHANDRYVEYLCTRAWLPDSSLWLFPPRDELFDAGGWYLQRNKHGQYSRFRRKGIAEGLKIPEVLDASIPLLLCAFKSLNRMNK